MKDINTIKHIRIYDFDDTLFFSPIPDTDKNGVTIKPYTSCEYKLATGKEWSHKGWWGRRESLDMNIFDIKKNNYVHGKYVEDMMDSDDKLMIMMTGRIIPLKSQVMDILNTEFLVFDAYYFNDGRKNTLEYKIDVFDKYIKECGNLESIKIYDDRSEHIPEFINWANKNIKAHGIDIEVIHIQGEKRIN